jgi:aminoglycoside phosphotransferase (APT) family kinase protein
LQPPAAGSVFPPPPGSPFDFPATAAGAEWIEEIGARARALLEAAPRTAPVVGHFDWRSENIPVAGGRVVAVFDWDSVGAATEPIVVGSATHHFTLDWRAPVPHVPTLDEVRAFVADYETARGKPFTTAERVAARTAYVFCTAYGARCEHVLASSGQPAPTGFRDRLASAGAALLG